MNPASPTRRLGAALGTLALATAMSSVSTPAHASLLDPLLTTVTDTVSGILGQAVPTGWLFDESSTTLPQVRSAIGATSMWQRGYTGKGIGVALVDTGVVPVDGLKSGNVVNGPDLSFEGQSPDFRYLDTFGHGTHMAGIIAGKTRTRRFQRRRARRQADQRQDRDQRWRRRRLTSGRRRRLGGQAPQRRPGQSHPGAQPLLRHRRDPGLPGRPAGPRRGERLACRHRGRGRRRQPGRRRQARQPGLRPASSSRSVPPTSEAHRE